MTIKILFQITSRQRDHVDSTAQSIRHLRLFEVFLMLLDNQQDVIDN